MASYLEWNESLSKYFAIGLAPGEAFYLSVDEDALMQIGRYGFAEGPLPNPVRDFELAVRAECVSPGRVQLPVTTPIETDGTPACLAFLGAMVLAAYRMAQENDIDEKNYFTRLREVLDLPEGSGRPPGMSPAAIEEPLWIALNNWILGNGWQPSAERGPEGPTKYTNFPLSQSLLREGDKGKLESQFREGESELRRDADWERVGSWFFNRAESFSTSHIRTLALGASTDRYNAIVDAVYGVYTAIDWEQSPIAGDEDIGGRRLVRRLTAGLYREFDPLFGTIVYHLFPRAKHKHGQGKLSVVRDGKPEPLHQSQDGHFRPLWPVSPAGGVAYLVDGDPLISELRVPARDFWILTRDRYYDSSGVFASRDSPRLGETFLLLCRKEFQVQIDILKDEGLLNWDGDPVELLDYEGWVEYRECQVLSANWDGIIPQNPDLFDELRPRSRASISLQGGLKAGERNAWIEGHCPELWVSSYDRYCQIRVSSVLQPDDEPLMDESISTNMPIRLNNLAGGVYRVEAIDRGRTVDSRYIKVLSWESLEPQEKTGIFGTKVGEHTLHGGLLVGRGAAGGLEV